MYVKPEKGSNLRVLKISPKLEAMLKALPRKNEHVFRSGSLDHFAQNFRKQRKRIAFKMKNPRINMINFKALRYFKAPWNTIRPRTYSTLRSYWGIRTSGTP